MRVRGFYKDLEKSTGSDKGVRDKSKHDGIQNFVTAEILTVRSGKGTD